MSYPPCYTRRMMKMKTGTKVQHKSNGLQGVVVSEKCFGKCARNYNVMVHLTCGLQYEVSPYALKEITEFSG